MHLTRSNWNVFLTKHAFYLTSKMTACTDFHVKRSSSSTPIAVYLEGFIYEWPILILVRKEQRFSLDNTLEIMSRE